MGPWVLMYAFILGTGFWIIERQEYIDSHAPCMETFMGCAFMFFVGLSMPSLSSLGTMHHSAVIFHVVMINILMLLGKLIICFFYSNETTKTQRIALGLAMCPRGEIGASVIIITIQTLKDQIDPSYLGIVVLSVIMNLVSSCALIVYVKKLAARA